MDEINDFFDFSKPFKRETISAGYVDGRTVRAASTNSVAKRQHLGTEYVAAHRAREDDELSRVFEELKEENRHASPSTSRAASVTTNRPNLNDLDSQCDSEMDDEYKDAKIKTDFDISIYDRYAFEHTPDPNLSIVASRTAILRTIAAHPVTVLQGCTGCGKSTQLPQFLLDEARTRREHCNIVVTQPRRIAARSIAQRVANERKWECGSLVGYQVGLSANTSEDTRLLFCTTGVLLEKLVHRRTLANYTHIVLDEVHERDQDMDFLLIVVRRLLCKSPRCKIILMSATIEAAQFAEYFRIGKMVAPVVSVEARRPFDVREFYLCDLGQLHINTEMNIDKPGIDTSMYDGVCRLCYVTDRIDNQDQLQRPKAERTRPTILIFLPGILEIETLYKKLETLAVEQKYQLLPLHSSITIEEQQRVFRPVPIGVRKIILSTNVAESSLTIPDVKYVFDFCLTKALATDSATNFTSLQLCWASRNNCIQRSGRAGRVMNGRVYRLVPRVFFEHVMCQAGAPELLRCPLDRVVLKAKELDMGAPHALLASAMDPPQLGDIENTVLQLKEMGGLLRTVNGDWVEHDGDLTYVGRLMAALPVDVRVSRLLVFGYCFSVLEECIIMAAGLNVKSIFNTPFSKALLAYTKKLRWSDGSGSDLFAILKAYRCWLAQHQQANFENDEAERTWANRFFLQVKSLKEMTVLIAEMTQRLDILGIRQPSGRHAIHWTAAEKSIVLKCVIAGAFYPNYFMRMPFHQENDREAHKELCGRDPNTTVFFRGFNHKHIGALYTRNIKRIFADVVRSPKQLHVSFDPSTEKIFVQFRSMPVQPGEEFVEAMPGQVAIEVYKAVKMRACAGRSTVLRVLPEHLASELAERLGLGICESGHWVPKRRLYKNIAMIAVPLPATAEVSAMVCHIVDPHCFHVQSIAEQEFVNRIYTELNAPLAGLRPFARATEVRVGCPVACRLSVGGAAGGGGGWHRGRVTLVTDSAAGFAQFHVRLIDFGVEHECQLDDLRRYAGACTHYADVPPRAFECRLAELQPSQLTAERGQWTSDAIEAFRRLVMDGDNGSQPVVRLVVYSVLDRVAHVYLHAEMVNVNEFLVGEGLAQVCDESYASKCDHIKRIERQRMPFDENTTMVDEQLLQQMAENPSDEEYGDEEGASSGDLGRCLIELNLSGPHSPLESKVYGAAVASAHRAITVEPHSVNSVMLEDRSQDMHNNVLVAATVTSSERSGVLCARETTQMPNIPGFGALMALVFAPLAELKPDALRTRYVSVLCGLGQNREAGRPAFAEHDVHFELDVTLNATDVGWINQIRWTMDTLLFTKHGQQQPKLDITQKHHYMMKIKERITQLLERRRERIGANSASGEQRWGYEPDVKRIAATNVYGDRTIFPFHEMLCLAEPDEQLAEQQRANCADLHRLARLDLSMRQPLLCEVCQILLSSAPEVKLHLYSRLHVDREKLVGFEAPQ